MYIHNMDNTSSGIKGRIQRFTDVLQSYEPDLYDLLLAQVHDLNRGGGEVVCIAIC